MSHFYDINGNAVFEVPNASKGGMRPTTIKDARKLALFPSVTTILDVLSKGDLNDWRDRQITEAAFLTQPKAMELPEAYHDRIMEAAFKKVDDAADLGTRVHKAIEQHFQGQIYDSTLKPYVDGVDRWIEKNQVKLVEQELRLCNTEHGFAGTTDAAIESKDGKGILDFKTRKTKPGKEVKPYDTQIMQIAAYGFTKFGNHSHFNGVNVYVSTTEVINGVARVEASWYTPDDCAKAWGAFLCAAALWRYLKDYDPRRLKT